MSEYDLNWCIQCRRAHPTGDDLLCDDCARRRWPLSRDRDHEDDALPDEVIDEADLGPDPFRGDPWVEAGPDD